MNTYPKLFSPIKIGETTVKNRVFMPPISTNLADKGYVTDALVEHYAARAKGGVGLIQLFTTGGKMIALAFLGMAASVLVCYLASRVGARVGRDLRVLHLQYRQ